MSSERRQRRAADKGGAARRVQRAATAAGGGWSPFISVAVALIVLLSWGTWYLVGHRPHAEDASPSWAPDGLHVVFTTTHAGGRSVTVMNADGTEVQPVPVDGRVVEGAPAFSPPDGARIAYDAVVDGNREIFVMAAGGQMRTRLTTHPGDDHSPAWSPDARHIAFVSDRDAKPNFDVYVMSADGTGVERITTTGNSGAPQYSPDGSRLAFHSGRDIYVYDFATKVLRRLTTETQTGDGLYPTWAPGGAEIAFASSRAGRMQLFTMRADGRDQKHLLTMPTGSAIEPRWSPVGDRILFVHVPETAPRVDQRSGGERAIYVVEVSTGKVVRLSR